MIQVYTGEGKGKTTAAIGLAVRAAGAGKRVYICQFLKKGMFSELKALKKIKGITCRQFGSGNFCKRPPAQKDMLMAKQGLESAIRAIRSKRYDVVILDELNIALSLSVLRLNEVVRIFEQLPSSVELVITGRKAHPKIIKLADLVSEIKELKHYFKTGTKAREGIEY